MQKKKFCCGRTEEKKTPGVIIPRGNWPGATGIVYSLNSASVWLAECTVWGQPFYTDAIRHAERYKADNHFFFAIDNRWEQPVCMCFGRNGVNTYLSGLPWSTSKLHAWREKRKKTRKSVLRQTTCIFVLIEEAGNLKYTSDNLQ